MTRTYDKDILYKELVQLVKANGGLLLTKFFTSAKTKVDMICANGHKFQNTQTALKNGRWCRKCGIEKGSASRMALKGDAYLKEICKGRTIVCLDTKYLGVKANHQFQCKVCKNIWNATPDSISQGTGCPPCSNSIGKIVEPMQKGKMTSFPPGTFGDTSPEIRTFAKTQVQFTGPVRKHYEALGYESKINTLIWIKTEDLPPTSSYQLSFECTLCQEVTKRPLYNAIKTRGCGLCYGNQIGDSLRKDVTLIENKFGIKVTSYTTSVLPLEYTKECGCAMTQSLAVLRLTGVGYCIHDSEYTWRTFENLIRDELGGKKAHKTIHGVSADCITDEYLIEIKLNIASVFSNFGRRKPMDAIERYKGWAEENNRTFYVVVNEPCQVLKERALPPYYLGWEKWSKIGLLPKHVELGKMISKRPQDFRTRKSTKEDLDAIKEFKRLVTRLDRIPTIKEIKAQGITIPRLAIAVFGSKDGSIRDIASALGITQQPAHISPSKRAQYTDKYLKESKKAGYLLGSKACRELTGVSLNQIMRWALKSSAFSMEELQTALKTKIPLNRMATKKKQSIK